MQLCIQQGEDAGKPRPIAIINAFCSALSRLQESSRGVLLQHIAQSVIPMRQLSAALGQDVTGIHPRAVRAPKFHGVHGNSSVGRLGRAGYRPRANGESTRWASEPRRTNGVSPRF